MALIICPECGKEISDSSKKCIHCGYKLKKEKSVNKKPIIIAVVVIIVAVVAIVLISSILSPDEQYVYEIVMDYRYKLKDPSSLTLSSKCLILSYADADESSTPWVYFDAYASNSYGAQTHSLVVYKGSDYLGDLNNANNVNSNASMSDLERSIKLLGASYSYNSYFEKLSQGDASDYKAVIVNMKKIARKIGCGYIE